MGRWRVWAVAAGVMTAVAAGANAAEPVRVVVTIPPLRGMVEPLLREAKIEAAIEMLIPPGVSEHGYEIPPSKVAALAKADLVLMVGLGLEPQVEKMLESGRAAMPWRRVVVMAAVVGAGESDEGEGHAHEHEHGDDHSHGADPHIWLDPVLVEKMIGATAEALREVIGKDQPGAERLLEAKEKVAARVREVDERYRRALANAPIRTIVVGHDAWGRLASRYGFEAVPIKGLNASEPTPAAMQAAAKAVREKRVPCIFTEPQLGEAGAKRLAEATGVPVRVLDPLGDGDWFKMMDANLLEIARAMGQPAIPVSEVSEKPAKVGR